jgi:hypothetical protein
VASWSTPSVLAPASRYASSPRLAVSEDGDALVAWYGPPEPPSKAKAGPIRDRQGSSSADRQPWSGSSVMVDTGTVAGGFDAPTMLTEHAVGELDVAISGTGVRYVTWRSYGGGRMIAVAAPGAPFSPARALPMPVAQLLASPAGPVAAVWQTRATIHYALLEASGEPRRPVSLPGQIEREGDTLALNDLGAFAAVQNTADFGEGTKPPHPIVHLCDAVGRCLRSHSLQLGHAPAGSEENDAVALSDDGALTVLASFSKALRAPGPNRPGGLWSTTRSPDGRWSPPQGISDGGELPLAASDGDSSAVTVFQHFWSPQLQWLKDRIEVSALPSGSARFVPPRLVRGVEAANPAALATNQHGRLLVAWIKEAGVLGGERSTAGVYAVSGSAADPPAARLVWAGEVGEETPVAGIDAAGQSLIVWSGPLRSGRLTGGIYASTLGVP